MGRAIVINTSGGGGSGGGGIRLPYTLVSNTVTAINPSAPTVDGAHLVVNLTQPSGGKGLISWGANVATPSTTPAGPTPPLNLNPTPGAVINISFVGVVGGTGAGAYALWSCTGIFP